MHHSRQPAAVIEISRVPQVFIVRDEFARVVLDVESPAEPIVRGCQAGMIGRQSAID